MITKTKKTCDPHDYGETLGPHLDLCKDVLLRQENQHWEYSRKALGISTFNLVLFGFGIASRTFRAPWQWEDALILCQLSVSPQSSL